MQRFFSPVTVLLATSILLVTNVHAQQTPAQKPPPASTSKTQPSGATSQSEPPLTTDKDKLSYAIGMNIGTTLHRQSLDIDPKVMARGIADTLAGGTTLLTDEQAKAVLEQLQEKMQSEQAAKIQAAAETNKKEGDAYLAANQAKEGVVTLPSGLQYKILRAGTGPKPALTDTVICNYQGTLIDGKVFDSSYQRGQPVTIPVNKVIKGFTEALQLMPVGSKWELVVPPSLAYGENGAGADIGPNATIIFDVELLSIQPQGGQGADLPATPSQSGPANGNPNGSPK
jgi:FKBP-type peptidyl-prolyl cis-trans isomerase FklB